MTNKNKLSSEKIKEIRENFNFFDRDDNGMIDDKEFSELLLTIEPRAQKDEIENGFKEVDTDSDGSIDFPEFLAWWNQCWWQF